MGGAKSKFEQTDWIRADGKLRTVDQTIDGSPPTSAYGVYFVTKAKFNQREFTVTDLEKNLLYTTKVVPGTLCWFDVHGRGIDDYLLRVQVDLSRRYWVVYRMGIPCFAGQLADREATDKLANDRREAGHDLTATPFLFRKCCIAVSWSRYMAVCMQYGAPEGVDLLQRDSKIADESESNFFYNAANITARMRKRGSKQSLQETEEEEDSESDTNNIRRGEPEAESAEASQNDSDEHSITVSSSTEQKKLVFDATKKTSSGPEEGNDTDGTDNDQEDPQQDNKRSNDLGTGFTAWVAKQRQVLHDNKFKQLRTDPLEGIIHLDKPLLLCQEIYDKLIGNHQTSAISRGKAIELLRQDLEEHMKDDEEIHDNDYPFLADQDEIFAQIEAMRKAEEDKQSDNIQVENEEDVQTPEQAIEKKPNDRDGECGAQPSFEDYSDENHLQQRQEEGIISEPQHDCTEKEGDNDQSEGRQPNRDLKPDNEIPASTVKPDPDIEDGGEENKDEEDLCGYWKWENTWKTHQMKMHVAKGSDLALHVVMAIIVNQVRYERNAIAMTV